MNQTTPPVFSWSRLRKIVTLDNGDKKVILDLEAAEIPFGCMTCILGDSGSGKTTLLSILGLVDTEFEGVLNICLDGQHIHSIDSSMRPSQRRAIAQSIRRHIGFVFQECRLRPGVDALRNVVDPMTYLGIGSPALRKDAASQALTALRIAPEDHVRRVAEFSGGMQQRVAIARALASKPGVICADEPTAHVDDILADQIYADLKHCAAQQGTSVIVVTHDKQRAKTHADHVIYFQRKDEVEKAWPFEVIIEDKRSKQAMTSNEERLSDTSTYQKLKDMWLEAMVELSPFGKQVGRLLSFQMLWSLFGHRSKPVASHRYMPNMVAVLTFALLATLAFFLFSIQQAVVEYQQERLQSLEILRRVRAYAPSSMDGQRVPIDLDEAQEYIKAKTNLQHVAANYELLGYALNDFDVLNTTKDSYTKPIQNSLKRGGGLRKRSVKDRRLTLALIGAESEAPVAVDLGVSKEQHPISDVDKVPQVIINENVSDWYFGGFSRTPRIGDRLSVVFATVPKLVSDASSVQNKEKHREALCITFEVSGYFNPRQMPADFFSSVEDTSIVNGLLDNTAFKQILQWKYDPLAFEEKIPNSWRCKNAPKLAQNMRYKSKTADRSPAAMSYDFYAATPRDVQKLYKAVEDYGHSRDIKYSDLRSEFSYINGIVQIMDLVRVVGALMILLPLLVAAVVLGLVVYNIVQRRRDELLLLRVMGTSGKQLQLQCFFITTVLVLPAVGIGYLGGILLPTVIFSSTAWLPLPVQLAERLVLPAIGAQGLLIIGGLSVLIAGMASVLVVRSITTTNPSSAFRGVV